MKQSHEYYMNLAYRLALKGMGLVSPNPCVGAVVVDKRGNIISKGYHKYFGGPHAEVEALLGLNKKDIKDSTLYVTLEPCNHYGKTPPCTELIIKKGIKKVVVGIEDKNPLVEGKGIKRLKEAGIEVIVGVIREKLSILYKPFFKYINTGLPFVTLKVAQSLDGKNSVREGNRYLVSEKTLKYVHRLRFHSDAIMVGINTILDDNPRLDIRYGKKKPLIKVILDTHGRIPEDANVYNTSGKVIIYTANRKKVIKHENEEIVYVGKEGKHCNLKEVLTDLGKRGIQNLLVEGGGKLSYELLKSNLVDRLVLLLTPYIIGGKDYLSFSGDGFNSLKESIYLNNYNIKRVGRDILLTSDLL
ncbi:MAG: bifunctional diaminohydroxyphosphoribosylaminopyrimidine deaminase/5-amino-6-(5-phosphoribosylamino)uracil reductase RibD [Thermodesulfovibrio sp.]|nr:bifunctional diaminohydroxyphosphoribosylaminopyrimidine deaminase/5-amino-6-(5-phosphoribosylamino)uracil reductase RibD [Thermodesulfovibrio sp.]